MRPELRAGCSPVHGRARFISHVYLREPGGNASFSRGLFSCVIGNASRTTCSTTPILLLYSFAARSLHVPCSPHILPHPGVEHPPEGRKEWALEHLSHALREREPVRWLV